MKRLVYLDASAIRQANFALSSASFTLLQSLAAHGLIEVITSDITLSECESLLLEQTERVISSMKKAAAEAQLFTNLGDRSIFELEGVPDIVSAGPALVAKLRTFFESTGFTKIDATSRPSTSVFAHYFGRKSPFGSAKKKSEFPDAFVLEAIVELAEARSVTIDVVSGDKDWSDAAHENPRLRHYASLSQLMRELQALPGADLARAEANFRQEHRNLQDAVADMIVNQSVTLADSVGEVQSVDVEAIEVEEPRVTTIDEKGIARYECYAAATLKIEVVVPREDSYLYDSEEKTGEFVDWEFHEIEREVGLIVDFALELEKPRKVEFEHAGITLNYGKPIQVYLDTDAETHYK